MRLARRSSMPTLPSSLAGLANVFELGSLNQYSCCEQSFFQGCVRDVDGRAAMIFACTNLIQLVEVNNIEEIHIDATFKVVPSNMGKQMLSIHCMIGNHSIPVVYCLMESKSRNSYKCCWFHHNQAVWKNKKKKGFLNLTNSNQSASKALRMLLALPLLPAADIERGFDAVRIFAINQNVPMVSLFDYYQNYWLRQVGVHALSVNGQPRRTNNYVESFHNSLRIKFNVVHPNLWKFLDHLTQLSKNVHITRTQLANTLRPTRKQHIYSNIQFISKCCL
ncbi:unnamed protein product [Macrosiphum euphorbiae]|uniref:MULE transposase domain-containing protein n=1 Tax=Macrosiphum euphorbiae TaxID=13131 RepID=A0AAV0XXV1_9HEMI|nr:unnamed protein product [Macrosiphum euphorbiae]